MNGLPNNHELAVAINTLTLEVKALKEGYAIQQKAVEELKQTLQKGKGGAAVLMFIGGLVIGIASLGNSLMDIIKTIFK